MAGALGAPADLFSTANYIAYRTVKTPGKNRPLFSVVTASLNGNPVTCGNAQTVQADLSIDDVATADVVILPGLLADSEAALVSRLASLESFTGFLRRMHDQGAILAAGCTGVFVLAESGLLDFQTATTTWWLSELFRRRYPNVDLDDARLVVESGKFLTAAAGTSYLDLSLALIRELAGPSISRQCAAYLCLDGPRESQNAYAIPHHRQVRDPFIEKADEWIRANASQDLDIPQLAQHMGVSPRTLGRRFLSIVGKSPSDYIQQVRIDKAKYLLQNSRQAVAQIAGLVGYRDEDAFRRAFKKQTSMSPASFRRRLNNL